MPGIHVHRRRRAEQRGRQVLGQADERLRGPGEMGGIRGDAAPVAVHFPGVGVDEAVLGELGPGLRGAD